MHLFTIKLPSSPSSRDTGQNFPSPSPLSGHSTLNSRIAASCPVMQPPSFLPLLTVTFSTMSISSSSSYHAKLVSMYAPAKVALGVITSPTIPQRPRAFLISQSMSFLFSTRNGHADNCGSAFSLSATQRYTSSKILLMLSTYIIKVQSAKSQMMIASYMLMVQQNLLGFAQLLAMLVPKQKLHLSDLLLYEQQ